SHARRHVGERAVAEDRAVQGREEIVVEGDDGAEVLAHEVGMLEDRLGERAEDDAEFRELVLERRRDRDAVQHGVDRDAGQAFLLLERDAEFRVQGPDLGIDILEALHFLLRLRGRVVDDVLIVDRGIADVRPHGLLHREPVAIGPEPPLGHPFRLLLLARDEPDDVLVEALRNRVLIEVGDETVFVLLLRHLFLEYALRDHATHPLFMGRGRDTITSIYISLVASESNNSMDDSPTTLAAEDLTRGPAFKRVGEAIAMIASYQLPLCA